jgi:hypothetical protein
MKRVCLFLKFVLIYLFFFSTTPGFAQLSAPDSNFYKSAVSATINVYDRSTGDQSALYNCMLYTGYPFLFKSGSPFFDSTRLDTGSVTYDGKLYTHLPMLYENLKDLVLIKDIGFFVQLNDKKLHDFTIPGHHFVWIEENQKNNIGIISGFYEVLYDGNIRVLKKNVKQIVDDLSSDNVVEKVITQSDHYYLEKDSTLFQIKNKRDIMHFLSDKKKEIKQFIKRNKLNFYEDKGNALTQITAYYEQITK